MKKMLVYSLFCLFFSLIGRAGNAQEPVETLARFSANKLNPLVGEPVELTLMVTIPAGNTIVTWPEFPPYWENFEVRRVGDLVIEESGSTSTYRQNLEIVLWLPGEFQTPEITLTYQKPGETTRLPLTVEPAFFTIPSVLTMPDAELLPLRPLISLPYIPRQIIILSLCVLVSVAYWVWVHWRQRSADLSDMMDGIPLGDLDRAVLRSLQEINANALEPAAVYQAAADCIRDYVQRQYQLPVRNMTTSELVRALERDLPVPLRHRLQELLLQADVVKFSLHRPNRHEGRNYLEHSARWIQAVARDLAHKIRDDKEAA